MVRKLQKKMENNNPKPKELEQDERYEPIQELVYYNCSL